MSSRLCKADMARKGPDERDGMGCGRSLRFVTRTTVAGSLIQVRMVGLARAATDGPACRFRTMLLV